MSCGSRASADGAVDGPRQKSADAVQASPQDKQRNRILLRRGELPEHRAVGQRRPTPVRPKPRGLWLPRVVRCRRDPA
jgi:hypothetical protein